MGLFVTLGKMAETLFVVAIGYLANRLGYLNDEINRKLTGLMINIVLPCMILASVLVGDTLPEISAILSVLKVSVLFYGLEAVFLLVLPRLLGGTPKEKGVWQYGCIFPNMLFIGYPVVTALFGSNAMFYGVILVLPFNVLTYSVAPMMLGGEGRFHWKNLCTPVMITSVLSLVIALTGFRAPELVGSTLDFAGSAGVPLSLIILGSVLAGMGIKRFLEKQSNGFLPCSVC